MPRGREGPRRAGPLPLGLSCLFEALSPCSGAANRSTAPLSVATSQDVGVTCPAADRLLDQELMRRRWEMIRPRGVPRGHSEGMF